MRQEKGAKALLPNTTAPKTSNAILNTALGRAAILCGKIVRAALFGLQDVSEIAPALSGIGWYWASVVVDP